MRKICNYQKKRSKKPGSPIVRVFKISNDKSFIICLYLSREVPTCRINTIPKSIFNDLLKQQLFINIFSMQKTKIYLPSHIANKSFSSLKR